MQRIVPAGPGRRVRSASVRRVVVIGSSGSGKTTFARLLAERLGVPHIELDALHWTEGDWREPPPEVFRARVTAATAAPAWVLDGGYVGKLGTLVWERADTLIWLDVPFHRSFWRMLRRSVARVRSGQVLWGGNRETLRNVLFERDSLIFYTLRAQRGRARRILDRLARPEVAHLRVLRFRSDAEAARWLAGVGSAG